MANVTIKFNNKEFILSCEDGQEEHLEELLIHISQKFNNLKNDLGNLGENKLLLITAVKIMDEYYETKKKVEQRKDEFKNLSNKFKEIKYKELLEEHGSLSKKLEEIKNKEKQEKRKQIEFSEKIDELNQETDTLLEEIDKWEM